MTVNITGMEQMMSEIRQRVGDEVAQHKASKGIEAGAQIVYKNMQNAMSSFRDTGASAEEVKVSKVDVKGREIKAFIYWEGPMKRYTIVHLNEHGYTRKGKRYTTRGYGAIARALRQSQTAYFQRVRRELES